MSEYIYQAGTFIGPTSTIACQGSFRAVHRPLGSISRCVTPPLRRLGSRRLAGAMRRYQVSARGNRVENDDEGCAKPIGLEVAPQRLLFG
jgi:hypothetical protein